MDMLLYTKLDVLVLVFLSMVVLFANEATYRAFPYGNQQWRGWRFVTQAAGWACTATWAWGAWSQLQHWYG